MLSTQEPQLLPSASLSSPLHGEGKTWEGVGSHLVAARTEKTSIFGLGSFLSLCHYCLKVNVLVFKCLSEKGRKLPGQWGGGVGGGGR